MNAEYNEWMSFLIIVMCVTFAWFSVSFLKWRSMSVRRSVRLGFLCAALGSVGLVILGIGRLFVFDSVLGRAMFVTYFAFGSFIVAAALEMVTNVLRRRIRDLHDVTAAPNKERPEPVTGVSKLAGSPQSESSEEIIDALIAELRGKVDKRKYKVAGV